MRLTIVIDVRDQRTLFQIPDIAAGQGDPDFVDFGSWDSTRGVILFFSFGDVTHFNSL
jgi:hypothetical protein